MAQAGLLGSKVGRRYAMRPHSIRKFFRTQMAALGVNTDYIEYMMGHKISTYHDVQMKGVEFLRNIYAASGISIKPKTRVSKIDALKEIIRAWGMNPEEILAKEALSKPHRTYATPAQREEDQIKTLAQALKETIKKELLTKKV
jgi:aryl-alcohol dehydrogenase-like predicted oxidoreductase